MSTSAPCEREAGGEAGGEGQGEHNPAMLKACCEAGERGEGQGE